MLLIKFIERTDLIYKAEVIVERYLGEEMIVERWNLNAPRPPRHSSGRVRAQLHVRALLGHVHAWPCDSFRVLEGGQENRITELSEAREPTLFGQL